VAEPPKTDPALLAARVAELETELGASEAELRLLRTVVANAPVTLWVVDRERRFTFARGAAFHAIGLEPSEIIGKPVHELFPTLGGFEELVPKLLAGGTVTVTTEVGETVFESKLAACTSREGQMLGIIGVSTDVTDRVAAQQALERELRRIERLESLAIVAGGFGHDLNNLLAAMLGFVGVAQQRAAHLPDVAQPLRAAETAALGARDLTKQLLTFSRAGAPLRAVVALGPLIEDATLVSLRGSSCKARLAVAEDLWAVDADAGQLAQVLHNLLLNAAQAMPEGGNIEIAAANFAVEATGILPLEPGRYVELVIADQGVGIAAEHLDRAFDPYFTTKSHGTGLGLTTAHSIVRRHGGHVRLQSTLGVGTTLRVYLPATDQAPSALRPEPAAQFGRFSGRALVMDDEPSVAHMVRTLLTDLGFDVEVVGDGAAALVLYEQRMKDARTFDVVLLDLTVAGGMGGKETMRRLLQLDPDARAIVSTGYSNDALMSEYRSHGFRGALAKPYRTGQLAELLARVLAESAD
jgi:two-component system cell cycle sensor histidine kinase/response regulator CckA